MKLVTVATHSDVYFPFLLESCARYNAHINVLGWNQKWAGYIWKFLLVKDFVNALPNDEIVCFVDAYDVILTRPLEEFEKAFKSLSSINKVGLVVGCDHFANSFYSLINKFVFGKCHNKPLNSGTYIGYVKNIKEMINEVLPKSTELFANDQIALTSYCKQNPRNVYIDCDNLLFLTILNPLINIIDKDMFITPDKQIVYKGARPFFIHGNGNTNLNTLLIKLGYNVSVEDEARIRKANIHLIFKKIIHYLPLFLYIICTVLTFVAVMYLIYFMYFM
jgi:hypothetical protein